MLTPEDQLSEQHDERKISLAGAINGVPDTALALFRSRLLKLVEGLVEQHEAEPFRLIVQYGTPNPASSPERSADSAFVAQEPQFGLDQLVLSPGTLDRLLDCISIITVSPLVFDKWGLRAIEPHPSVAVNFRGPPGTGKTMAAHGAASHLDRKLVQCRLSELESRYHGDGPKNLTRLFRSAADQDAVLFIDEAESLLSRRFSQPEQAAESAINSMRTELLMALDTYRGLVIFASNLPHSYDPAMDSRLLHVDFGLPDYSMRKRIWEIHLPPELPTEDVNIEELASVSGVSGRDIKLAVIYAAVNAARHDLGKVTGAALFDAIERQRAEAVAQ
jgi:ATP-dependent 26S proteasome regulatory subunit